MHRVVQVLAQVKYLDEVGSNKSELRLRAWQPYGFDYVVISFKTSA